MDKHQRERYARHILLKEIGGQGQNKLLASRILVVGAGGIGSPILQYLAAAGVGALGVVDDDAVALSNLQRQTIYATEDVGAAKTDKAKEFIARLNPDIAVTAHRQRMDRMNAADVIKGYDLVVEGVDNFETRYVLNAACIGAKKPLLSAAVSRFGGQLSLFKAYEKPGVLPCYRCLVPQAPPQASLSPCEAEGVLGAVTGVMGALAAQECLKELLGIGESLAGRLLIYNALSLAFRIAALPADPACQDCPARV